MGYAAAALSSSSLWVPLLFGLGLAFPLERLQIQGSLWLGGTGHGRSSTHWCLLQGIFLGIPCSLTDSQGKSKESAFTGREQLQGVDPRAHIPSQASVPQGSWKLNTSEHDQG